MARVPIPGGDAGNWGGILNDFLAQAHEANGQLKDTGILASKYMKPAGGIPASDLHDDVQNALNTVVDHTTELAQHRTDIAAKANQTDLSAVTTRIDGSLNADGTLKSQSVSRGALAADVAAAIDRSSAPNVQSRVLAMPSPVLSTMASGHGWVVNGSPNGTVTLNDTSEGVLSDRHISVVTAGAGAISSIRKSGLSFSVSQNLLRLYLKIEHIDRLKQILVYVSTTAPFGDYVWKTYAFDPPSVPAIVGDAWTVLDVDFADTTGMGSSGAVNLASIQAIQVNVTDRGSGSTTLRLGGVGLVPRTRAVFPHGVCSFTFDDGWLTQYTKALPILAKYGFPATAYIINEAIGKPGFISSDQLIRLHDVHGWEIGAHAATLAAHNAGLDTLSPDALEAEFAANRAYIARYGLGGGDNLAWPLGRFSGPSLDLARKHFASARSTIHQSLGQSLGSLPGSRMQRLNAMSLHDQNGVEAWPTTYLDPIYAAGTWFIIYGHKIEDAGGSDGLTLKTGTFSALVDAVAAKGIPVMTVGDVIRQLYVR